MISMFITPITAALGGAILGLATAGKLITTGRILGISGAFKGLFHGDVSVWRAAFIGGMAAGSVVASTLIPDAFEVLPASYSTTRAVAGGLLVGFGAALGNGCTSGHGICGNARLSKRSMLNTLTFMATGAAAATLTGTAAAVGIATDTAPALQIPTHDTVMKFGSLLAAAAATFGSLALAGRWSLGSRKSSSSSSSGSQLLEFLSEAAAGVFFALGLAASGMTRPSKVAAFLSPLLPAFDPSLMCVMGAGLAVATPVFQAVLRGWSNSLAQPACKPSYDLPAGSSNVDAKLLLGGAVFGVGWGVGGMCPGPALVSLAVPSAQNVAFVASMLAGMLVESRM